MFYYVFYSSRSSFLFTVFFLFTELDAVLQPLGRGVAAFGSHVVDTIGTGADESEASHPRRNVRLKRTYKMKKAWEADEVVRFFTTGAKDAAGWHT